MDILQQLNINGGTAALLAVGLCVLCIVGPLLLSGLHFVAAIVDAIGQLITMALQVVSGGPQAWCGCLVVIGGCGFIAFVIWLLSMGLSTCGTDAAMQFCSLFGR
jgi:hypothetical protein